MDFPRDDFDELDIFPDLFTIPPTPPSSSSSYRFSQTGRASASIHHTHAGRLQGSYHRGSKDGFKDGFRRSTITLGPSVPSGIPLELDLFDDYYTGSDGSEKDLKREREEEEEGEGDEWEGRGEGGIVLDEFECRIGLEPSPSLPPSPTLPSPLPPSRTFKRSHRPISLTHTLKPRRASTGERDPTMIDWAMVDLLTPTGLPELENMAKGFPGVPMEVEVEVEIEAGYEMGFDLEEREEAGRMCCDRLVSWRRNCTIHQMTSAVAECDDDDDEEITDDNNNNEENNGDGDKRKKRRGIVSCDFERSPDSAHRRRHQHRRRLYCHHDTHQRKRRYSTSSCLLFNQKHHHSSWIRQLRKNISSWAPMYHSRVSHTSDHDNQLEVESPLPEFNLTNSFPKPPRTPSNRSYTSQPLPRVPEEHSISDDIQFSSPPLLPLRSLPSRAVSNQSYGGNKGRHARPESTGSVETLLSIPSLGQGSSLSPTEFSPSTTGAGPGTRYSSDLGGWMTGSSNGSGTFGMQIRYNNGSSTNGDSDKAGGHLVRNRNGVEKGQRNMLSPLMVDINTFTPSKDGHDAHPHYDPHPKDLDVGSHLPDMSDSFEEEYRLVSEGRSYQFPLTPEEDPKGGLFFDASSVRRGSVQGSVRGNGDVHSQGREKKGDRYRDQTSSRRGETNILLGEPIQTVITQRSNSISTSGGNRTGNSLVVPEAYNSSPSSPNQPQQPNPHGKNSYLSFNPSRRGSTATHSTSSSTHPFASPRPTHPTLSPTYNHHQSLLPSSTSYSNMGAVTLVPKEDMDLDEQVCVICCESLNPLYRLEGERGNVTANCGHSLHHACFTAVYGPVKQARTRRDLGVCGVCRQPMRLDEDEMYLSGSRKNGSAVNGGQTGGGNKFAAMMGLEESSGSGSRRNAPGRKNQTDAGSLFSQTSSVSKDETLSDDPVESFRKPSQNGIPSVIVPFITVQAEHNTISRKVDPTKRGLTCMITVQVPSSGQRAAYSPREDASGSSSSERVALQRSHSTGMTITPSNNLTPMIANSMGSDPFAHVATDLKNRLTDYKGSGLDTLGRIRLFDILQVRKGEYVLDIMVFLYDLAIVCVAEEKKKGLKHLLTSHASTNSLRGDAKGSKKGKTPLKLKGRIYFRDVARIVDSSLAGELSITVQMKATHIDSFILVFRDKSAQSLWMNTLNMTLEDANGPVISVPSTPISPPSTSSSSKLARMGIENGIVSATQVRHDNNHGLLIPNVMGSPKPLAPIHTPIDLVFVAPLPSAQGPSAGSYALKLELITSTLKFMLATLGNYDRICLVVFQQGQDGWVKRTPFLNATRTESRQRLDRFIDGLANCDTEDEFPRQKNDDERVDIISAVNSALDNLLQRKVKNPVSGMIVVNDAAVVPSRASMDLVIARLEAASVPIHSVGFTKNHEPSPLWLLSNATNGTYVSLSNEWNQLRDVCAGILGGLMSISMTSVKLSISAKIAEFKVRKVQGAQHSMISSDGKTADIDLGHLVSGSKVEVLVDMERKPSSSEDGSGDHSEDDAHSQSHSVGSSLRRIQKSGSFTNVDALSADSHSNQMWEEGALDDLPVLAVDCQYSDPAAGRQIARLSDPRLLIVTISSSKAGKQVALPSIVRRKAELLASESITRAILLVSRNNWSQARRVISETSKILAFNLSNAMNAIPTHSAHGTPSAVRKEAEARATSQLYSAILEDLDILGDGCEEELKDVFDREHRTHSAQQALILRKQLSWTSRTATEQLYLAEGSHELIGTSRSWSQR